MAIDPKYRHAFKLLFSETPESELELRKMLDDAIKPRYGSERTLSAYLSRKKLTKGDKTTRRPRKNIPRKLAEGSRGESSGAKRKAGSGIKKSSHSKRVSFGSSTSSASNKLLTTAIKTEPLAIKTEPVDMEMEPMAIKTEPVDMEMEPMAIRTEPSMANVKEEPLDQNESEEGDLPCLICSDRAVNIQNTMAQCYGCLSMYQQQCHEPQIEDPCINNSTPPFYYVPSFGTGYNELLAGAESGCSPVLETLLARRESSGAERESCSYGILNLISAAEHTGESSGTNRSAGIDILNSSPSTQVFVGPSTSSASDNMMMTAINMENVREEPVDQDEAEEDLAFDILEDDLSCVVCRVMAVGVGNQMVECVGCHSLYHQECHNPPIEDIEINDPRSAWYCAPCRQGFSEFRNASLKNVISTATFNASQKNVKDIRKKAQVYLSHLQNQ